MLCQVGIACVYFVQSTGWSALFFTAADGNLDLTRLLIQGGADVWLKDRVCMSGL